MLKCDFITFYRVDDSTMYEYLLISDDSIKEIPAVKDTQRLYILL
jgi:hypothetical protein